MLYLTAIHSLMILAGGFIALHFVERYPSLPLKIAAWILILGGGFVLLGAIYLGSYHWREGIYDRMHHLEMPYESGPKPVPQQ